jgi:formate dehydrogenase major subunit
LGSSFGRGAATTAQWDLANADSIIIMGSNMAENHPIAFRFVLEAKARGATIIHADPRFTRTSALADLYAPVRAGSDIAFLGGVINYILERDLWFKDYVMSYTNIASIINDDFKGTEELDGLFSGWDEAKHAYQPDSWQYKVETLPSSLDNHQLLSGESCSEKAGVTITKPVPQDPSLQDPRCVYQIMRRHYAKYTPEMVERVTGCPKGVFLKVCDTLTKNSGRERTGAWCYAVGWTHHTTGVQMIRGAAIIQALLGNIGRPGGGILALRGHSSIQGSTDVPTLYNLLPGYLPQPRAGKGFRDLDSYMKGESANFGWWHNMPKYIVSLLRAWYGPNTTKDTAGGYGYHWIPKIVGDHSQLPMMLAIQDKLIRGLLVMGQNPVIGGHNTHAIRMALPNLEWMVIRETFENELASYWYKSPEVQKGQLTPTDIQTEMFLLPASLPGEKEGTFTNTQRLIQWHDKVVEGPADCRSDLWFMYHLGKRLKELYKDSTDPIDEPIQNLTWDYPTQGPHQEPNATAVLKEINGCEVATGKLVSGFTDLKDDGSTACGVWIYSGIHPEEDKNLAQSRMPDAPGTAGSHQGWGYSWPHNRRILYNRASADPDGKPWSEAKKYVWWDAGSEKREIGSERNGDPGGRWVGYDVPDFEATKAPDYVPDWSKDPKGMDAIDGKSPCIMMGDGKMCLFVPAGLKDGPLPTHYEPVESPVSNPMYRQQDNPAAKKWARPENPYHLVADPRYPYAFTTYRLTEHHSGGIPTRMVASTAELQPEGFAEVPPELAAELGIENLNWVVISTARGEIETKALVTERLRPFEIDGKRIYQIGMPWHFGWQGYATGDIANVLSAIVGDPNTTIHEGKAFTCNLRKGRLNGH